MHSTTLKRGFSIMLAGYAAGAAWLLLETVLTQVSPANRVFIAFLLPTVVAVLLWLFHTVEAQRPVCVHEPGDRAATERVLLRIIVFIVGLHGLVLLQLIEAPGIRRWGPQLAFFLVGGLLVSVGNLLPRTRPNVLVGIRTRRSLRSRHFWMEINRAGGYVSVALGVMMIAAAALLHDPLVGQVSGLGVLAAVTILVVRYCTLARGSTAG